jgi:hypothetical protein
MNVLCCIPFSAYADLPLDIEDLLTDKGKFKLDVGLTYANINRSKVSVEDSLFIQVGPTQFVRVPTDINEKHLNRDTFIPSIGLRYGLTANTELYGRSTWLTSYSRVHNDSESKASKYHQFDSVWLGLNHRFIEDQEFPAVLGFIEGALAEKRGSTSHGKTWLLGTTIYRSIDPVVLSLTAAYQYQASRYERGNKVQPGNIFILNPQLSFAANDKVTLTGGITWRHEGPGSFNFNSVHITQPRHTATNVNLGVAYLWNRRTTLNFTSRSEVSGQGGIELGFFLQYKLGELPQTGLTPPSPIKRKE